MTTDGEKDLLGADSLFAAIVEDDFGFVLGKKVRTAMEVLYFIVVEVLFINAIQPSNVGVALMLEGCPIEGSSSVDRKAVGS